MSWRSQEQRLSNGLIDTNPAHGSRLRKHMVVDNRGLPHSTACLNT
jgi:hypothetical protein